MNDFGDLRDKIDRAKQALPLPALMQLLGLQAHAKKTGRCPFEGHEDKHPSFSIFKGNNGFWCWKCHTGCGEGDEIAFLSKWNGTSRTEAISRYLEMAGFPSSRPPESREYPECPESPACPISPISPMSPVSEGQAIGDAREKALLGLAARHVCAAPKSGWKRNFELAREIRAIERMADQKLDPEGLKAIAYEWHRLSLPFLDPKETPDDSLATLAANLEKVRFAKGEDPLTSAIRKVAQLTLSDLPAIPKNPHAPEEWRRIAALHRELSIYHKGGEHFLSYRNAAKVVPGLSHQQVHTLTLALKRFGVFDIVDPGRPGKSGRAAVFVYLLPEWKEGPLDL